MEEITIQRGARQGDPPSVLLLDQCTVKQSDASCASNRMGYTYVPPCLKAP